MKAPYWKPFTHPPETRDILEDVMVLVRGAYERAMELLSEWEQMFKPLTLRDVHPLAQKGQILRIRAQVILISYSRPSRNSGQRPMDPFEPIHAILQQILTLRSNSFEEHDKNRVSDSPTTVIPYCACRKQPDASIRSHPYPRHLALFRHNYRIRYAL